MFLLLRQNFDVVCVKAPTVFLLDQNSTFCTSVFPELRVGYGEPSSGQVDISPDLLAARAYPGRHTPHGGFNAGSAHLLSRGTEHFVKVKFSPCFKTGDLVAFGHCSKV